MDAATGCHPAPLISAAPPRSRRLPGSKMLSRSLRQTHTSRGFDRGWFGRGFSNLKGSKLRRSLGGWFNFSILFNHRSFQ